MPSANVAVTPARINCPFGYTVMYTGYLLASHYTHARESEHTCVDESPKFFDNTCTSTGDLVTRLYVLE